MFNKKTIFRVTLAFVFILITQLKISAYYDIIAASLVLILLIFDIWESNHDNDSKSEVIYYSSWIIIGLTTFHTRGAYFGPYTSIFLVSLMKLLTLITYLIKYRSFCVSRSILSKFWLYSLALYLIELLVNSTHGFAQFTLEVSIISSIETFLILITEKTNIKYKSTILNFLWK